ncbi:MAG TPA: energy transducer TonB [Longimicrobiaceae bacterium]|nr:energy transducer TonB [Longimicrobiaceae bacterium]
MIFRSSLAALPALAALLALAPAARAQGELAGVRRDPPLSALVDSAALVRALGALAVPEPPQGVPPVFTVAFDSTGAVRTVEPLFDEIPSAYAEPVAAAIRAHLRPQPPRAFSVFLRAVAGPGARVDLPTLEERPPVLVNRGLVAALLSDAIARYLRGPRLPARTEYRVEVRVRVLASGMPDTASVQIALSSGEAELDAAAARVVSSMRFRSATVEGIPVRTWVQLPIIFRFPLAEAAVSAVLDSAAVVRALADVPAPTLPHGVPPLFRIAFADSGRVETVEPVTGEIPADYARRVVEAIRASLKPQGWPERDAEFFLRVVAGPQPVVARPASVGPEPRLLNVSEFIDLQAEAARRLAGRFRLDRYEVVVKLRVLPDGSVAPESVVVVTSSREPELDEEAVRIARRMRFAPREVDGVPVPAWDRRTVRFVFAR